MLVLCLAFLGKMGWRELAIFYLLKIEGNKMLKTWLETMKEEIVTMQEELGTVRDLEVAREDEQSAAPPRGGGGRAGRVQHLPR